MKVTSGELTQNPKLNAQGGQQSTVLTKLSTVLLPLKRLSHSVLGRPALLASLAVTGLLVGSRHLGLLEPLELSAYDRLMQLRPALPPDPRLLVVKITEKDIQSQPKYPITDEVMNQLLTKLEQYQPAAIGLDMYREKQYPPGHADLSERLKKSDRIIPVCKKSDGENPAISAPASVPEGRVGFSDVAVDKPNGIIRRALFFTDPNLSTTKSGCNTPLSFSFQLAQYYLAQKGIQPELTPQQQLKFGKVIFKPLLPTDGGYQHADAGGYQILLNYRSSHSPAASVTLTDVLNGRFDPSLVKGRIVLIGVSAPSEKDDFYTPHNSGQQRLQKMPGVMVHGQIVSQILSSVLDGRPLFWYWPEWGEGLWILGWSVAGGVLVRVIRHPGRLVLAEGATLGLLFGISVGLFFNAGWIPVVAPSLGLIATATGVLAYSAYQAEQERIKAEKERIYIEEKAKEQERNIALLQGLLKERTYTPESIDGDLPLTEEEQTELPSDELDDDPTTVWPQDEPVDASTLDDDPTTAWPQDEPVDASTLDDPTTVWPQDKPVKTPERERRKDRTHILAGHYQINRVLGSGGFGLTFLAQDIHRPGAPQCVVKHLKPARRDEKFLQIARRLFDTEAEILEKLGSHPQIPRLLAHFEESKEFYLVQEFIDGHPLNEELPVDKRLPEAKVMELLKGVLEILIFIHEHKVIHRDIKPSNIMRRQHDGQLFLIDFGAVKQIQPQQQDDQEGYTVAIGTRGYAPPEQYAGHPVLSSDIYALGMIAIQALTGIPPYQLPLSEKTADVTWRHLANVQEDFAKILENMVRYHFVDRYQSAAEVMKELKSLNI